MAMIAIKQSKQPISRARAEALDSILSFMFLSENKESWDWIRPYCAGKHVARTVEAFNKIPLRHFDGADVSWLYESLRNTMSYGRLVINPAIDQERKELSRLVGPWNSTVCAYYSNIQEGLGLPDSKISQYLFSLDRIRTVPLRDVRGLFRLRSSTVIESSQAHLFNDGTYLSDREYLQYFAGGWHCVGVPVEMDPPERLDEAGQMNIWLHRSLALTTEYDWTVHIGFNVTSVPTVSIPSDPISARDVFKLRDVPAGKSRRDALRHWVSGHVRHGVEPNYVETYIWPYLRGAEEFTWNGLYCRIQPSAYDLRKAHEHQLMRGKRPNQDTGRVQ